MNKKFTLSLLSAAFLFGAVQMAMAANGGNASGTSAGSPTTSGANSGASTGQTLLNQNTNPTAVPNSNAPDVVGGKVPMPRVGEPTGNITGNANGNISSDTRSPSFGRQTNIDAQQALISKGFGISADGVIGGNSQAAIRQYQSTNGLPATGTLDDQTLKSLGVDSRTGPTASDSQ